MSSYQTLQQCEKCGRFVEAIYEVDHEVAGPTRFNYICGPCLDRIPLKQNRKVK